MSTAYHPLILKRLNRQESPTIKLVYERYYQEFEKQLPNYGKNLNILEFCLDRPQLRHYITRAASITEINLIAHPEAELIGNGTRFDFDDESLDAIFALDILHLLPAPAEFFKEVQRVLKPGGLLYLAGPGTSIAIQPVYKFTNADSINLNEDPLLDHRGDNLSDPFEGNFARLWLQFFRMEHHIALMELVPALKTTKAEWRNMFSYPLARLFRSGLPGQKYWLKMAHDLEDILSVFVGQWISSRLVITMEKRQKHDKNGPKHKFLNGPLFR